MGNPVVHFEISGADDGPLLAFYGELFGWQPEGSAADGYSTIDTRGGAGISGGIGKSRTGPSSATFYVETDDPSATLVRANELGGTTVTPVTDVGRAGTRAMFRDPDGLLVGLVGPSRPNQPAPSAGSGGPVTWFEILGADAARTQRFYADLFGWTVDRSVFPEYAVVDTGAGRGIYGGIGGGVDARWAIVYVGVTDVDRTLRTAEKLGGSRIPAPGAAALKNAARAALYGSAEDMSTGWARDPAGSVVGLAHKAPR
jgi:predicted enzyme related to lactoylglutathione lyase